MTANFKFSFHHKSRLSTWLSLLFFVYTGVSCKQQTAREPSLVWSGKQATGIFIPASLINSKEVNLKTGLEFFLQKSRIPMLGEYQPAEGGILFKPLIPLSAGRQYEVFFKKKWIGRLAVPPVDTADAPYIVALYPSGDTVPENLLKIYIRFSSPMREGEALRHIYLLDEKADTIPGVFLDLQPELWNEDRTTLTLWLDPGRIKRGLIPNQRLGNPLKQGMRYRLLIAQDWKNAMGVSLRHAFTKSFVVTRRDDASPRPDAWKIIAPAVHTAQPLQILFAEAVDYFLAQETIQVINDKDAVIEGTIMLTNSESGLNFRPVHAWQPGQYRLRVAAILEDLAGNNLNKPFDRDILLQQKKNDAFVEREFMIAP